MRIGNFIRDQCIYTCYYTFENPNELYLHRSALDINRVHFILDAFLETPAVISFTAKRLAEPERLLTAFHLRNTASLLPFSTLFSLFLSLCSFRPHHRYSARFFSLYSLESRYRLVDSLASPLTVSN